MFDKQDKIKQNNLKKTNIGQDILKVSKYFQYVNSGFCFREATMKPYMLIEDLV